MRPGAAEAWRIVSWMGWELLFMYQRRIWCTLHICTKGCHRVVLGWGMWAVRRITIIVLVIYTYGTGRNDFDAGKSISKAIGRGSENRDFFGPWNGNERSKCHLCPKKLTFWAHLWPQNGFVRIKIIRPALLNSGYTLIVILNISKDFKQMKLTYSALLWMP
jgi:hypothetical protein